MVKKITDRLLRILDGSAEMDKSDCITLFIFTGVIVLLMLATMDALADKGGVKVKISDNAPVYYVPTDDIEDDNAPFTLQGKL